MGHATSVSVGVGKDPPHTPPNQHGPDRSRRSSMGHATSVSVGVGKDIPIWLSAAGFQQQSLTLRQEPLYSPPHTYTHSTQPTRT